jgi:glycine oxidase
VPTIGAVVHPREGRPPTAAKTSRVIVVLGAGLIGLAVAYELAKRGADVRVFDPGEPARAASWAGAGMLAPFSEGALDSAFGSFCMRSLALYPAYVTELQEAGGIDARLRLDGVLHAAFSPDDVARLQARCSALQARGVPAEWFAPEAALRAEPALRPRGLLGAAFFASEGQVDNRRLGRALLAACKARGVRMDAPEGPAALEADARRVRGVRSRAGFVPASAVINACGAWGAELEGVPPQARVPVVPVKGQMLALTQMRALVRRVVWVPGAYLVPRDDGRLLVGATVERAGFDERVTAAGMRALLDAALDALPALGELSVSETWAGLRPGSHDGLPYLGATSLEGYFVATGHYRNGILLTPATACALAEAVEGKPPDADVAAFSPGRLQEEPASRQKSQAC